MKKLLLIFILLLLAGCTGGNNSDSLVEKDYKVTANDVEFNIKSCTKYESNIYDYDFYILNTTITNKKNTIVDVETTIFTIYSTDVNIVTNNSNFFNGATINKTLNTEILLQAKKGTDISKVKMEIDFSAFSLGTSFTFDKILQLKSPIMFEDMQFSKFSCIKSEHYNILSNVIKNEKLDVLYNCTYSYLEELEEDTYIFSTSDGQFTLSIDKNLNYNMMHYYEGTFYDVYVDSAKNDYYISTSRIVKEYSSGVWQSQIKSMVDIYYVDASCSDFKWGRLEMENAMGISFTTKGKNVYGMTLTKTGYLFLIYNNNKNEFEISHFKIGDEILIDNRITVSFDTGTVEDISNRKVMKTGCVSQPELTVYKQGYEFVGWRKQGSDELFDFNTKLTSDTKLVAVWEKHADINCELIIDESITNIEQTIVKIIYNENFSLPVPYKNLYEFQYWYYIENGNEIKITDSYGRSLKPYHFKEGVYLYPKFEYSPKGELTKVTYEFDEEKDGYFITQFSGYGDIYFPKNYNNKPVIGIRTNSYFGHFDDIKKIDSITFPDTFKYIEDDFLHYSTHAETSMYIYFEDPDSIIEIGYSQRITALNPIFIGENCESINMMFVKNGNIVISDKNPNFVIENNALYSADYKILYHVNTANDEFYINDLVEYINDMAFYSCINLKCIHMPKNFNSLSRFSFYINGGAIKEIYFYNTNPIEIIGSEEDLIASFSWDLKFYVPDISYIPFEVAGVSMELNPYIS